MITGYEIFALREEIMKKLTILLIALMVVSVGFLSGCTSQSERCSPCEGTGKCNRCGGTGWAVSWDLKCNNCEGTGRCPTCGGSGYRETGVPGFELVLVLFAMMVFLLWKRKDEKIN